MTIKKNIKEYLRRSSIPPKYINSTFENFKVYSTATKNAFNLCRGFADKPCGSLFIYGDCGTGKTHLAIAIGRELVLQGKKVHFTCTPGLLYSIRKSFSKNYPESDCIERYVSVSCLVLDDLGSEKSSTWAKQTIDYIVYERDNKLRPMVITSNLSLDETAIVNPRVASRLAAGIVVKLCGPDYRQKRQS
jgi:DNA replication protein DnaC